MSWDKVLKVNGGKAWFDRAGAEGEYKLTGLVDCESEEQEPFKVWFEKVDYRPDCEVPEQDTAFPITTWVLRNKRRLELKAGQGRQGEQGEPFHRFCKLLVVAEAVPGQHRYSFSTDVRVRFPRHTPLDEGEPLTVTICNPGFEQTEGNFVWFAHFAEPFDLMPDPGKVDLKGIRSSEHFTDILQRTYHWPLDKE